MKLKRFYFDKENLMGNKITLVGDEFSHAVCVMRMRAGDKAILFCGDGKDYVCEFCEISKKSAVLEVCEIVENNLEAKCNLTVFQALAKGDKLSLIAQKLTEIGASELKTFYSEYCDVKPNTSKLDRLEGVVINACKQCGRSVLTAVGGNVLSFKDLLLEIKNFDKTFFAYENAKTKTLFDEVVLARNGNCKNIALIVGPEGGFSEEEASLLDEAGAVTVSLGKRILRTETCAIMASGVIIQAYETQNNNA